MAYTATGPSCSRYCGGRLSRSRRCTAPSSSDWWSPRCWQQPTSTTAISWLSDSSAWRRADYPHSQQHRQPTSATGRCPYRSRSLRIWLITGLGGRPSSLCFGRTTDWPRAHESACCTNDAGMYSTPISCAVTQKEPQILRRPGLGQGLCDRLFYAPPALGVGFRS